MNYVFHVLTMVCIYVILGLSLNLVVGYCGMLSLCHAAFYGIGAYASALMLVGVGWSFPACLAFSVMIAALLAFLIAIPAVRFRGDFFVLATMGFQTLIFSVLYNWVGLTKGPYGISDIPRPHIGNLKMLSAGSYFLFSAVATALVWLFTNHLSRSPYGRALQAVRDDYLAALALGKRVEAFRRSIFCIAGALAAVAGALFASYASYIDPTSFTLDESVFIFCTVVIGGAGSLKGPLIGALVLVLLPELLRITPIPDAVAANARQMLYGLFLLLMMRFRPQGICGKYTFS